MRFRNSEEMESGWKNLKRVCRNAFRHTRFRDSFI